MNPPESMKNDETKKIFDLQVLSACIKQPGAITYFAEHINPDDVGKIHGYMGIHEFYKALLNLFKETKLDPIDINAAKGWILAETDIADALGGEPGLASFLAELDVLDTAEYTSIVKIVAARAKKRKQLDHVQKMKEEIQKLDTSPDEISKLTDQIRILAKELDNNPMEKVRTADHIAAGIDELWEIPPFLPTQFPQLNRAMGYCLDPETEILTSRGWLRYNEIDAEQETILAFSEDDNILRWEKLQGLYVDENYDGPMIELSNSFFTCLATPNHRWTIKNRRTGKLKTCYTTELPKHDWSIVRHANFELERDEIYSDEFVKLCAWYYTEGCSAGKAITLYQSNKHNPEFVSEIRQILESLGASRSTLPDLRPPCIQCGIQEATYGATCYSCYSGWWHFWHRSAYSSIPQTREIPPGLWYSEYVNPNRPDMVNWFVSGGDVSKIQSCISGKDKIPSPEFISNLSQRQAELFRTVALKGDGTKSNGTFKQCNVARMDAFMAICVLAGYNASTDATGETCSSSKTDYGLQAINRKEVDYSGVIWCPITISGYWVARRNGKTFITGNSPDKGGFFRGGVHCIAALSGQGKSTLARSLCNHWLDEGYSVLFINFEEPKAHWERILMTQVIQENVYVLANNGTSQDLAKYTSIFHDKLSEWGDSLMVRHDPDTLFFEDLEMWLRDVQGHGVKPDIVVIDTIQSMFSKTGGRARWGEFEQMMVGLEKLAKDMDAVFIITAQQNINSTREKREKLDQSDMGGSITITQKSTVAMMLTPQKSSDDFSPDQTKHDTSIMEIQIIKNRITGTEYKDAPPLVEYDDRIKSYKAYDPKQDPEYVKITLDPLEHGGFGTY